MHIEARARELFFGLILTYFMVFLGSRLSWAEYVLSTTENKYDNASKIFLALASLVIVVGFLIALATMVLALWCRLVGSYSIFKSEKGLVNGEVEVMAAIAFTFGILSRPFQTQSPFPWQWPSSRFSICLIASIGLPLFFLLRDAIRESMDRKLEQQGTVLPFRRHKSG